MTGEDDRPANLEVACLCPTYGRARELGEAVRCFLEQRYAPRELLICNDAPEPILSVEDPRLTSGPDREGPLRVQTLRSDDRVRISILNTPLCRTLGHKYQRMLEQVSAPIVAHWEDDDLFLPDHLSVLVAMLERGDAACVKSDQAHVLDCDAEGHWSYQGVKANYYESQMLFRREAALRLGGYGRDDRLHAMALLEAFDGDGSLRRPDTLTYVYRWDVRLFHGQCCDDPAAWRAAHTDFASVIRTTPVDRYWRLIRPAGLLNREARCGGCA